MTEVVSWAATVVLVLAVVGLFAHLVEVFRAPTRRPRVPKRDRFGELVAEDENPGPEIAPGRHPSDSRGR